MVRRAIEARGHGQVNKNSRIEVIGKVPLAVIDGCDGPSLHCPPETDPLYPLYVGFDLVIGDPLLCDRVLADADVVIADQGFSFYRERGDSEWIEDIHRSTWRELTGDELGDDVYVIAPVWSGISVAPCAAVRAIVEHLQKARCRVAFPWLFRSWAISTSAAPGEEDLIARLEARVVAFEQLADAAPELRQQERLALHAHLELLGVTFGQDIPSREEHLERYGAERALAWSRAAKARERYSRDRRRWERIERTPFAGSAAVSLEHFLSSARAPDDVDPCHWLAEAELRLAAAALRLPDAPEGSIRVRLCERATVISWVREQGGFPFVHSISALPRGKGPRGRLPTRVEPPEDEHHPLAWHRQYRALLRSDMAEPPTVRDEALARFLEAELEAIERGERTDAEERAVEHWLWVCGLRAERGRPTRRRWLRRWGCRRVLRRLGVS